VLIEGTELTVGILMSSSDKFPVAKTTIKKKGK
jgi:hypothetical protein